MKKIVLLLLSVSLSVVSFANVSDFDDTGSTSEKEMESTELTMYPNPSSQYVNIASDKIITRIVVRAQNGTVVAEVYPNSTFYNLNVENFAKARYFVTLYSDAVFETQTILVK